jgi:putative phosphodiesterase I
MKKLMVILIFLLSIASFAETYVKVYELSYAIGYSKRLKMNEKIINDAIKEEYDRYKAKVVSISVVGNGMNAVYILFEK